MNAVARRLDIDSRVASQPEPDLISALERAVGKQPPKFREQRRESLVGSRGKRSLPQRVDELVTPGDPVAVDVRYANRRRPWRPGNSCSIRRAKLPGGWTIQRDGLLDQL